jgi:hypothetical protein
MIKIIPNNMDKTALGNSFWANKNGNGGNNLNTEEETKDGKINESKDPQKEN